MKNYEILGGNLPVVVCELSAGESMITESGSMSWMSPNMKMETTTGGGVKKMLGRLVSGDSAFQNKFTAEGGDGTIAFASSFPGAIKALNISAGHSMIVQKSAFLASEAGVELSMHFQKKLGSGFFGACLGSWCGAVHALPEKTGVRFLWRRRLHHAETEWTRNRLY